VILERKVSIRYTFTAVIEVSSPESIIVLCYQHVLWMHEVHLVGWGPQQQQMISNSRCLDLLTDRLGQPIHYCASIGFALAHFTCTFLSNYSIINNSRFSCQRFTLVSGQWDYIAGWYINIPAGIYPFINHTILGIMEPCPKLRTKKPRRGPTPATNFSIHFKPVLRSLYP